MSVLLLLILSVEQFLRSFFKKGPDILLLHSIRFFLGILEKFHVIISLGLYFNIIRINLAR